MKNKLNSKIIAWHLAVRSNSPFFVRKQLCVVPNVSWGLLDWEADLIVCSKQGYLTEIEIKVSMADWKADFSKSKWVKNPDTSGNMIKKFYYAAPTELANRYPELQLPEGSGVIGISDNGSISILKDAIPRLKVKKLSILKAHKLLRLASIKAWGMALHPTKELIMRSE